MKKVYPSEMEIEYESNEKTILSMYDKKEKSEMIIYHIFKGLDLVHNKFNTYNAPESNQELEREYIEINYCTPNENSHKCRQDSTTKRRYSSRTRQSRRTYCSKPNFCRNGKKTTRNRKVELGVNVLFDI